MTAAFSKAEGTRHSPERTILSYQDLKSKGIRFSRQWIVELVKQGKFPKPVKLGEASTGFIESEVDAWIESLIRQRDEA